MNNIRYGRLKHLGTLSLLCLLCLFFSCCRRKDDTPPLKTRTVIVYMVGDNTLNGYVDPDINEMERGWKDSFDGDLIVYVDQKRIAPYILKISSDRTNSVVSKEVMKYSEQNSSSMEVMEKVISDIKNMYPAKSYGLILWSHASGWLPAPTSSMTKAFGDDNGEYMEITELAKLSGKYDFLIFDACDMMGVEVAYELRHNADYIVGSVTEILAGGFPYHDIMSYLFEENADLVSVCKEFMELYRSYSDVEMQTAALSVVKTGNLDDIASVSRNLIQRHKSKIASLDVSQIQKYDSNETTLFFDFLDFMEHIADNDIELQTLRSQLSSTVIFEDHTPSILNEFEIKRSSGLSCYIPGRSSGLDYMYGKMAWYKAT
ncbi:MAG: hypothetical protein LBS43_12250, partial [Prevotellaceae bacterium]|nr:hypothetical protein [Prevotellaceae bacterium]